MNTQIQTRSTHILLETAFDAMIMRLSTCRPPFATNSNPADLRQLGQHLADIAAVIDSYIAKIGTELAMNAPYSIPRQLFMDQLLGALDGNAIHACNDAADQLAEDMHAHA